MHLYTRFSDLSANSLHTLNRSVFVDLINLQTLLLDDNPLASFPDKTFVFLRSLQFMYVHRGLTNSSIFLEVFDHCNWVATVNSLTFVVGHWNDRLLMVLSTIDQLSSAIEQYAYFRLHIEIVCSPNYDQNSWNKCAAMVNSYLLWHIIMISCSR